MSLTIGDKAPSFILKNTEKQDIALSDYAGKNVVILFFPLAFSGTCTTELCSVRDTQADYDHLNAEILAISVDSLFTLGKFKSIEGYNFQLLSDWNKETALAYGALYDEFVFGMKGVAKRSAFVVDKDGIIRYAEVLESAGDLPNFAAINETLKALA
ncbi:MAG TPA: redoxin domain-containing protein [Saprospiraceae bacterium]|jgi:peroxiredoxin|nr:redoxin domain-containing protein [Saprospiraceae bacterium]HRO09334.1 redoxin domain-containing protein [Saprospiraceae bacterium]HRO74012.1 redoxin domain-containing protein [Saprospiraceae bacterium]HRP42571.1 redoxin domain-containing protein [Saprospiraceae bacterium]